jgi:peptidoglycan biosynthesis protein MviN/MurJ (putative lipid II flippase)
MLFGLHLPHAFRKLSISFCHIWVGVGFYRLRFVGYGHLLCFFAVGPWSGSEAEGSACGIIRGTCLTPAAKETAVWRNDLTSCPRFERTTSRIRNLIATFGNTVYWWSIRWLTAFQRNRLLSTLKMRAVGFFEMAATMCYGVITRRAGRSIVLLPCEPQM